MDSERLDINKALSLAESASGGVALPDPRAAVGDHRAPRRLDPPRPGHLPRLAPRLVTRGTQAVSLSV